MKYLALACFVAVLGASCTPPPGVNYGPYPSTPFSSFLTGSNPMPLPIGTPKPPVGSGEFLLTIQNEDDGGTSGDGGDATDDIDAPLLASSYIEVTRVRDGEQLALLELGPCQLAYVVIDCLDRPVRISAILPDMTEVTRLVPAGNTCIDRTFYITRTAVAIEPDPATDTDGTDGTDGTDTTTDLEYVDVYNLSEVNSVPRCSGDTQGLGGFGGFGGGN